MQLRTTQLTDLDPQHVYDVVIVGGSFAGAAAAVACAKRGMDVLLCEPGLANDKRLAGELLQAPAARALEDLGFGEAVWLAGAVPACGIAIVAPGQREPVVLPYAAVGGLHPSGLAIEHATLASLMLSHAARQRGVTYVAARAQALSGIEDDDAATVTLTQQSQQQTVRARIVVAADGKQSRIRKLAGIGATFGPCTRMCGLKISGHLPFEGFGHVFLGERRPLLAYRIAQDAIRIVFEPYSDKPVRGDLDALPPMLRAKAIEQLGTSRVVSAVINPMSALVRAFGRVALIGDAGGTVHPISASGVSFALADAQCLTESLATHQSDERFAVLAYANAREQPMRTRAALGGALAETLSGDSEAMRALREGLLHYWASAENKAASMGLLSTYDGRPSSLALEYGKVAVKTLRRLRVSGASLGDTARIGVQLGRKVLAMAQQA
jgi:squalene monooxygenase